MTEKDLSTFDSSLYTKMEEDSYEISIDQFPAYMP